MPALDTFLETVLRSGLLDHEQLEVACQHLPEGQRDDPDAVATHLVRNGRLTAFQARKLLQGRTIGLLLGPYEVLAPLGRGGMGAVYLARDTRCRPPTLLALKILSPKRAREEKSIRARFRREMELSRLVAHPNLARTLDAGVIQGVYYIAMEFIPGRSLYRIVSDEGPLSLARTARLFREVVAGLEHAHAKGLIHRDLKPSNILVTPNDHAKVLDLGLALLQGEEGGDRAVIGGKGFVVGTVDYLAPEQAEDSATVDARADLYGLGCSLYFSLTGRPPFPDGTRLEKIARHRDAVPTFLCQCNPQVPEAFGQIVHRLMAKRPADRYATASLVQAELQKWSRDEPALPLDKPDDDAYRATLASLQTIEPTQDEDPVWETLVGSNRGHVSQQPLWLLFAGLGIVGSLFLLVVILLVIAQHH